MSDCVFCKIIAGEIPSTKVYEDNDVLAFRDINPQAPTHIIVIPKQHICCANMINEDNADVIAKIFSVIPKIAKEEGIAESGYRIVNNCGEHAGQTVFHIHFHILGGAEMNVSMA